MSWETVNGESVMSRSFAERRSSQEVRMPDRIGRGIKAGAADSPMPSDFGLGPQIWEALVRGHGSVKATAYQLGDRDPSQARRQVVNGTMTLREFHEADEAALCEYAEWVLDTFKPARKSKAELALEQLPVMFQMTIDALLEKK